MPMIEFKCIEILLRFLAKGTNLKQEIYSEFEELETFNNTKNNLFNMITINYLLENFSLNQSFSLEHFLNTGIIPGIYDEKTQVPNIGTRYSNDYKSFYKYLIEALKEENYAFDSSNDLFISSDKIETTIPQVWLYRLSQAVKRTKYERMYFYNKNKENNIIDKNSLIDYLRHTKTFLVELTSSNPNTDFDLEFISAQAKTNNQFKNQREVKVNDIICAFTENVSRDCDTKISKHKLADAFWIVEKAEQLGRTFYSEPLEIQQKYINKWILEYLNSSEKTQKETQKCILLANPQKVETANDINVNKSDAIAGLFNLYIRLLKLLEIDYSSISLSSFKIETYFSKELQEYLVLLNHLIKDINSEAEDRLLLAEKLNNLLFEMKDSDEVTFDTKKQEYQQLLEKYKTMEEIEEIKNQKRNALQQAIQSEQKGSIESIAFDNEKIMALLIESAVNGRISFDSKTNQLRAELYNNLIGKVIFKVSINIDKLVTLIENINYTLEESSLPFKVS